MKKVLCGCARVCASAPVCAGSPCKLQCLPGAAVRRLGASHWISSPDLPARAHRKPAFVSPWDQPREQHAHGRSGNRIRERVLSRHRLHFYCSQYATITLKPHLKTCNIARRLGISWDLLPLLHPPRSATPSPSLGSATPRPPLTLMLSLHGFFSSSSLIHSFTCRLTHSSVTHPCQEGPLWAGHHFRCLCFVSKAPVAGEGWQGGDERSQMGQGLGLRGGCVGLSLLFPLLSSGFIIKCLWRNTSPIVALRVIQNKTVILLMADTAPTPPLSSLP